MHEAVCAVSTMQALRTLPACLCQAFDASRLLECNQKEKRVQGQKVGSCAYVRELRRDRSGEFRVEDAWQLDDLIDRAWDRGLPRWEHRKMRAVHEGVDADLEVPAAEVNVSDKAAAAEGEDSRAPAAAQV